MKRRYFSKYRQIGRIKVREMRKTRPTEYQNLFRWGVIKELKDRCVYRSRHGKVYKRWKHRNERRKMKNLEYYPRYNRHHGYYW